METGLTLYSLNPDRNLRGKNTKGEEAKRIEFGDNLLRNCFKLYKSEWEAGQIRDDPELPIKDYDLYRKFESRILDS